MTLDRWLFSKEQIENSPSRRDGISEQEMIASFQAIANFMEEMGRELNLKLLQINTAVTYAQRFYMFHSLARFEKFSLGAAALFLAAKVEEEPRHVEIICRLARKYAGLDNDVVQTQENFRKDVLLNEDVLLQTLGFDVQVHHPHQDVLTLCGSLKDSKHLAHLAYILATYCLHLTTMCLTNKPKVIACLCIHTAEIMLGVPHPVKDNAWGVYSDNVLTPQLLKEMKNDFIAALEKCPYKVKMKTINDVVFKFKMRNPYTLPTLDLSSKPSLFATSPKTSIESLPIVKNEISENYESTCKKEFDDCQSKDVTDNKILKAVTELECDSMENNIVDRFSTVKSDVFNQNLVPTPNCALTMPTIAETCVFLNTFQDKKSFENKVVVEQLSVATSMPNSDTPNEDFKNVVSTPNSALAMPTVKKPGLFLNTFKEISVPTVASLSANLGESKQISDHGIPNANESLLAGNDDRRVADLTAMKNNDNLTVNSHVTIPPSVRRNTMPIATNLVYGNPNIPELMSSLDRTIPVTSAAISNYDSSPLLSNLLTVDNYARGAVFKAAKKDDPFRTILKTEIEKTAEETVTSPYNSNLTNHDAILVPEMQPTKVQNRKSLLKSALSGKNSVLMAENKSVALSAKSSKTKTEVNIPKTVVSTTVTSPETVTTKPQKKSLREIPLPTKPQSNLHTFRVVAMGNDSSVKKSDIKTLKTVEKANVTSPVSDVPKLVNIRAKPTFTVLNNPNSLLLNSPTVELTSRNSTNQLRNVDALSNDDILTATVKSSDVNIPKSFKATHVTSPLSFNSNIPKLTPVLPKQSSAKFVLVNDRSSALFRSPRRNSPDAKNQFSTDDAMKGDGLFTNVNGHKFVNETNVTSPLSVDLDVPKLAPILLKQSSSKCVWLNDGSSSISQSPIAGHKLSRRNSLGAKIRLSSGDVMKSDDLFTDANGHMFSNETKVPLSRYSFPVLPKLQRIRRSSVITGQIFPMLNSQTVELTSVNANNQFRSGDVMQNAGMITSTVKKTDEIDKETNFLVYEDMPKLKLLKTSSAVGDGRSSPIFEEVMAGKNWLHGGVNKNDTLEVPTSKNTVATMPKTLKGAKGYTSPVTVENGKPNRIFLLKSPLPETGTVNDSNNPLVVQGSLASNLNMESYFGLKNPAKGLPLKRKRSVSLGNEPTMIKKSCTVKPESLLAFGEIKPKNPRSLIRIDASSVVPAVLESDSKSINKNRSEGALNKIGSNGDNFVKSESMKKFVYDQKNWQHLRSIFNVPEATVNSPNSNGGTTFGSKSTNEFKFADKTVPDLKSNHKSRREATVNKPNSNDVTPVGSKSRKALKFADQIVPDSKLNHKSRREATVYKSKINDVVSVSSESTKKFKVADKNLADLNLNNKIRPKVTVNKYSSNNVVYVNSTKNCKDGAKFSRTPITNQSIVRQLPEQPSLKVSIPKYKILGLNPTGSTPSNDLVSLLLKSRTANKKKQVPK